MGDIIELIKKHIVTNEMIPGLSINSIQKILKYMRKLVDKLNTYFWFSHAFGIKHFVYFKQTEFHQNKKDTKY